MKHLITSVLLLLLVGFTGPLAAAQSPREIVENTSEKMIEALRANKQELEADPTKIYGLVNKIVLPHFDFELMSRWVLGKYWRQATPEQRKAFTEEFRTLLVRSYAGALLEYSNETIAFPPANVPADADDVTIPSVVEPRSGDPIEIDYSLRKRNGAWKVYDVKVNNVSLVINYRSTFANQIRSEGMDAMIEDLKDRNAKGTT